LARALRLLEKNGVRILRRSGEYRTQPVGDEDQPWFVNQVVEAETGLESPELLAMIKRLEREMKRGPGPCGGPRKIDVDILLAGRCIISTPLLRVPHPRLAQRNFVLRPLAEIAPQVIHPVLRKTVRRLLREAADRSSVQKLRSRR